MISLTLSDLSGLSGDLCNSTKGVGRLVKIKLFWYTGIKKAKRREVCIVYLIVY